jgi:hypothetical protein
VGAILEDDDSLDRIGLFPSSAATDDAEDSNTDA